MTDGGQTVPEGVLSLDILYNAVQPLKDKNVKVLSLGIGKGANLLELLTLASTSNDVFLAENFDQLKGLVTDLTQNKCPGKKSNSLNFSSNFLERPQEELNINKIYILL